MIDEMDWVFDLPMRTGQPIEKRSQNIAPNISKTKPIDVVSEK